MMSEDTSGTSSIVCMNCCHPVPQSNNNKNNDGFQCSPSSSSSSRSTLDVTNALETIFKLNYLKPFDARNEDENEKLPLLCTDCNDLLDNLYQLYLAFLQVGQLDSVLTKKLERLDQIIDCHERKSINCDLITITGVGGQEEEEEEEKTSNASASFQKNSSLVIDNFRQLCPKDVTVSLTRLPEIDFLSGTSSGTGLTITDEQQLNHDHDYPRRWIDDNLDDDVVEYPTLKVKPLTDICESDDDDEKPLWTYSRGNSRKVYGSSSKLRKSSIAKQIPNISNNNTENYELNHNNNNGSPGQKTSSTFYVVCISQNSMNDENGKKKPLRTTYPRVNRRKVYGNSSKLMESSIPKRVPNISNNTEKYKSNHNKNKNNGSPDQITSSAAYGVCDSQNSMEDQSEKSTRETDENWVEDASPSDDDVDCVDSDEQNNPKKINPAKKQRRKGKPREKRKTSSADVLNCPLCTTQFSTKFELSNHLFENHVEIGEDGNKTDCPLCPKKYQKNQSELKTHILLKHTKPEGKHECRTCGKKFRSASYLVKHIKTHEQNNNGQPPELPECQLCGKKFKAKCGLVMHMRRHEQGNLNYHCSAPGCDKSFILPTDLQRHHQTSHQGQSIEEQVKPFNCATCGKGFYLRRNWRGHELTHLDRPFRCSKCNRRFVSESDQLRHDSGCKERRTFACHICGKTYETLSNFNAHLKFHDGDAILCPVEGCDKKYYLNHVLMRHVKSHEKPFLCPDPSCGKRFGRADTLTQHCLQCHLNMDLDLVIPKNPRTLPQLSCPVCGESVRGRLRLSAHMRKHPGHPSHQCQLCEKSFNQESSLKFHLRIHDKDRKRDHHCTYTGCSMAFHTAQNLQKHIKTHTGEKDNLCPHCGKCFNLKGNLDLHMRAHADERKFKCQICHMAFNKPVVLKMHLLTHSDEKRFKCRICNKAFRLPPSVYNHEKIHAKK